MFRRFSMIFLILTVLFQQFICSSVMLSFSKHINKAIKRIKIKDF